MRKFYLQKDKLRYDLNNPKTGLLISPSGLGCEINASYSRIGDSFLKISSEPKQSVISGKIIFGGKDPYETYRKFVDFIDMKSMVLVYSPNGGEYFRDVDTCSITKGEMEGRVLKCDIKFYCKSLYYKNVENTFVIKGTEKELRFDASFPCRFNDYSVRKFDFVNRGHVDAPFLISIYGYVKKPYFCITSGDKVLYEFELDTEVLEGEILRYSSMDGNVYCYKETETGNVNMSKFLDVKKTNFFKFPAGESTFKMSSENDAQNKIHISIYEFFRMV